jgi:hypothetical protein
MEPKNTPKKRIIVNHFPDEVAEEERTAELDDILAQLASLTSRMVRLEEQVVALEAALD